MSAASSYGLGLGRRHAGMVFGVCAGIANRTGLPAWLPRLVFVVAGLGHMLLVAIAYGGLAFWFAHRNAQPGPRSLDRFGSLGHRLDGLETATQSREAELRRQFRDLR